MRGPLVVVRMLQDTTFHLAEPDRVVTDGGETVVLCGTTFGSPVTIFPPSEVVNVPVYRGRNEYHKCPRCDEYGRQRSFQKPESRCRCGHPDIAHAKDGYCTFCQVRCVPETGTTE